MKLNILLLGATLLAIQFSYTKYLALFFLLCMLFINITRNLNKSLRIRKKSIIYIYGLWIFILFMIRIPYIHYLETQVEVFWLIIGSFVLITMFISKIPPEKVIATVITTSIIGGGLALISYFSANNFWGLNVEPYAGTRMVGGFDGPNEIATYHILIVSLCLGEIIRNRFKISSGLIPIAILISSITIFYTFSRGALIGLGVILFLFWVFYFWNNKVKGIIYAVLLSFSIIIFFKKTIFSLIEQFNEVRKKKTGRGELNEEVWSLFSERPFLGSGLGSFDKMSGVQNSVPHSDFYVFMVSGGIVALVIFILLLIYLFIKSIRKVEYSVTFFIISFGIQAMTFNHLIRGRISILFWIIISVLLISYDKEKVINEFSKSKKNRLDN